jgi:hypothetical protein
VDATSVTIDNGIGEFSANGSIGVAPTQTTTYTITATGPWGTFTDSVTVYVLPAVQISASAATIIEGESTTLSWSSTLADNCEITPDVGTVDLNGSTAVSPTQTTTYTITASGAGGQTTTTVTITVIPPIALEINSPYNNDWILRPDVMVEGTFTHATGNETGITVNGTLALVYDGQFVAHHVPLAEGENTITVTATANQGYTATAEITVYAQIPDDYIRITADTQSGVSPFETELKVEGTFSFVQEPTITPSGPDAVDYLDSLGDDRYNIGMTAPGIYYISAEATDEEARIYTDTVALVVIDQTQLDSLLRKEWNDLKTSIIEGNIAGALNHHHTIFKDKYESIYNILGDNLPVLVQQMQDIELIYVEDNTAKYRINRDHNIDSTNVTITYYIYFTKDEDGLWKIEKY